MARKPLTPPLDGGLVIDKPRGKTSHDVVEAVRRIVGFRQIGHLGTLDPLATGVLVLLLGRASRNFTQAAANATTQPSASDSPRTRMTPMAHRSALTQLHSWNALRSSASRQ